jgi:hypothetical protein
LNEKNSRLKSELKILEANSYNDYSNDYDKKNYNKKLNKNNEKYQEINNQSYKDALINLYA